MSGLLERENSVLKKIATRGGSQRWIEEDSFESYSEALIRYVERNSEDSRLVRLTEYGTTYVRELGWLGGSYVQADQSVTYKIAWRDERYVAIHPSGDEHCFVWASHLLRWLDKAPYIAVETER